MSDTTGVAIPEGWYEDPGNPSQFRWWTGGEWSQHVSPLTGTSAVADDLPAEHQPVEPPAQQFAPVEPQPLSAHHQSDDDLIAPPPYQSVTYQTGALRSNWAYVPTRGGTLSVWMLAISPFVSMGTLLLAIAILGRGSEFIWQALAVASIASVWVVAFALLDIRTLRRIEHEQTAHWAWVLLGAIAYLIARTVVMRRYAGIGSAPLWVFIANSVVAFVATFVLVGVLSFNLQMERANAIGIASVENEIEIALAMELAEDGPFTVTCPADATIEPNEVLSCDIVSATGATGVAAVVIGEGGRFTYQIAGLD